MAEVMVVVVVGAAGEAVVTQLPMLLPLAGADGKDKKVKRQRSETLHIWQERLLAHTCDTT